MAGEEDNTDYESDPDEVKMSLKMRRREASDDEEHDDDVEEINDNILHRTIGAVDSGGESDGQGGADDYDYEEEYYDDEYDEDSEVEDREIIGGKMVEETVSAKEVIEVEVKVKEEEEQEKENVEVTEVEAEATAGEEVAEKVVAEPFAVPTSGAFYMHDDRFRDMADGRNRRTFGGKKLWESKDERKWGHDKFEELHVQDRRYEEGKRSSRGPYRGRGKARGAGSGYGRGNRVKQFSENGNQNAAPKDVRGRGPRKYQPVMKNNGETTRPPQYQQSARSFEKNSRTVSGRMVTSTGSSNVDYGVAPAKKAGSNLSSESPPFYPSGASTTDVASSQKKEMHSGNYNRNTHPSVDPNSPTPVSNPLSSGKNVINSKGLGKLHIDDSVSPASTKTINNNMDLRYSASSPLDSNQFSHHRGHGRAAGPSKSAVFQPRQTNNQVNKISPQASEGNKLSPVQPQGQSPSPTPGQQLVQRSFVTSQSSSPPKAGKGAVQGTGRGSVVYGGAQVMGPDGSVGASHGDSNIPAFFPVMQFGAQHPDRMASVGMAFPGYVQPNGLGSSEMTWLPMLASAAGALGATYCPPYLAIDGNYHPRPTGQTSALPVPSKDNLLSIPSNEMELQHTSEVANDEFSHRQKPRRYSEMNFRQ